MQETAIQPLPQTEPQTTDQEGTISLSSDPAAAKQIDTLQKNLSVGLIAIGTVMMLFVIARLLRRQSANRRAHAAEPVRQRPSLTPTPPLTPGFGSTATNDRLDRLMTDAEELTRRLAAILDNKAARVEILLEQADERLRALEAAANAAEQPTPPHESHPASHPAAPLSLTDPPPAAPEADPIDPLHRRVYDLADRGLTPVDIARQIDRPTGQVELILALRRA
ncbi:hypothetical protein MNBD_PLANCTO03-1477 [hydrothermal vent metagenome]|uniref:DUF2802 domain-containing protein n=1 Tax=hydrothermal vent metagenome TaxID=652676 RepID=A0A3B1E790_9ZZZZ